MSRIFNDNSHSIGNTPLIWDAEEKRIAQLNEFAGKTIVAILPDAGERYLSTVLFQDLAV